MKHAILVTLILLSTACQQASPPWDVIAAVLGDTVDAPKKPKANPEQHHPLE